MFGMIAFADISEFSCKPFSEVSHYQTIKQTAHCPSKHLIKKRRCRRDCHTFMLKRKSKVKFLVLRRYELRNPTVMGVDICSTLRLALSSNPTDE